MTQKVTLRNVRQSFMDYFVAKEFKTGDGKPRFNSTVIVEPGSDNDKAIRAAISAEMKEVFGDKAKSYYDSFKGNSQKCAYYDGTPIADMKGDSYEDYRGKMILAAHTKVRPTVIDRDKTPLTVADGKPYSGCYVNLIVEIYGQKGENPGLRASFSGAQFVKDGKAFGGGRAADPNEFEDLGMDEGGGSTDSDFDIG